MSIPDRANRVRSPGSSKPSTVTFLELPFSKITSLVIEYLPRQFSYIHLRIFSTSASCDLVTVFTKCGGKKSNSRWKKLFGLILIWNIYRFGWKQTLKLVISVIVPSLLIILFNLKAGRLIFKSPIIGIFSILPTSIFIYRGSKPLVSQIINWVDRSENSFSKEDDFIETEAVSVEDD